MTPPKETRRAKGRGQPAGILREEAAVRTQSRIALPPNLARLNAAAGKAAQTRFTARLHHVDIRALERAFRRQKRQASAGIVRATGGEVRAGPGAQPPRSLNAHPHLALPTATGPARLHSQSRWRSALGLPTLEDKIVQSAVAELLSAIYEVDFLGFGYGFRPGRNPHQALSALHTGDHQPEHESGARFRHPQLLGLLIRLPPASWRDGEEVGWNVWKLDS
jgi:RNA-directed DNA polymerase